MQHYIPTRPHGAEPKLSLGLWDEPQQAWERKARDLRIRRARKLKRQQRLGEQSL
jgi:hypothetical protein